MPATYVLIASNTLSSSAASVTFSSIPGTYTDLVLKISARNTVGSTTSLIEFNASSTAVYSRTRLLGDGASVSSSRNSATSTVTVDGSINTNSDTASTFSNSEVYIPSYTISQNKPLGAFSVAENNSTTAYIVAVAGLWRDTSAITSIKITAGGSGSFVTNSSFFLYGIKNS